jgi:hypothetical protein
VAVAAETAIRAWINARADLTAAGGPLALGAYLNGRQPRSPAAGAYALLIREPGQSSVGVVAEAIDPSTARITAHVYAGTIEAAEAGATALANAWQTLGGSPEPCGGTGVTVLVAGNFSDPSYVPMPATGGEQHCFSTSADFLLLSQVW